MSLGLIVGKVFKPEGNETVPRGVVALRRILGGGGHEIAFNGPKGEKQRAQTDIESNGEFALGFGWSGTEFAEDLSVIKMVLYADWSVIKENRLDTFAHGVVTWRGFLIEDVKCRIGLALPDLESATGLAAFGKSLIEAYRKVNGIPIPNVDWTSAECKLMLSAGNIRLVWSD